MNESPIHLPTKPTIATSSASSTKSPPAAAAATTPPPTQSPSTQCPPATETWQCYHKNLSFSHDFSHLYSSSSSSSSPAVPEAPPPSYPHPSADPPGTTADHGAQQLQQLAPSVQIWYCVHFTRLCQICLAMPLLGLVACLLIAVIFQFGEIQETACKVRFEEHL